MSAMARRGIRRGIAWDGGRMRMDSGGMGFVWRMGSRRRPLDALDYVPSAEDCLSKLCIQSSKVVSFVQDGRYAAMCPTLLFVMAMLLVLGRSGFTFTFTFHLVKISLERTATHLMELQALQFNFLILVPIPFHQRSPTFNDSKQWRTIRNPVSAATRQHWYFAKTSQTSETPSHCRAS
jgi:hypothetical protein